MSKVRAQKGREDRDRVAADEANKIDQDEILRDFIAFGEFQLYPGALQNHC